MAGERFLTRDHDTIRRWAEERGGKPSTVAGERSHFNKLLSAATAEETAANARWLDGGGASHRAGNGGRARHASR
jgi:hypothetical protein